MNNEVYTFNLETLIIETSRLIRKGHEAESNFYLSLLTTRLLTKAKELTPLKLSKLTPILNVMVDAQQRKDMAYVADILQYEIISLLGDE